MESETLINQGLKIPRDYYHIKEVNILLVSWSIKDISCIGVLDTKKDMRQEKNSVSRSLGVG